MAKKIIKAAFYLVVASLMLAKPALANVPTGAATTYNVTMKKLELCATGSSIDATGNSAPECSNPFVIGNSTRAFDIAGVSAGADLGSYGTITGMTVGTIYTHVRMTLSRTFSIAGNILDMGCRTESTDTHASTTSPGQGVFDTDPGTSQTLVIGDIGAWGGGNPTQEEYWQHGLDLAGDDFTYMVQLTTPFAVVATMPDIRVSFNTQTGLSGTTNGEVCFLYPNYPSIDITVTGGSAPPT